MARTDLSPIVGGIEVFGQSYDPDVAALDTAAAAMSRGRLRSGFGAPPVVPYAQRMGSGAILRTIFPNMFRQPVTISVLSRIRRLLP